MEYREELWHGLYLKRVFLFEGRKAVVVFPEKVEGNVRWMLKTEYFGAFPELELEMVKAGYALAWVQNLNRWGISADIEIKVRLGQYLREKYNFASKCILIGMSCGGLHAIKLAAQYPEMVSAMYLDAPVVNLLSCPFGLNKSNDLPAEVCEEALNALGIDFNQMLVYRDHPYDWLPQLIKARIPVALITGDSDETVHFDENGIHVKEKYEAAGIPLLFQIKTGAKHHPHGPASMDEVVSFLLKHDVAEK